MSTYATIPELTVPDASLSSPPSDASANWGKVYQNYISTNLSSENLAKGAYDAYNLLTTKNLNTFSIATVNAITSLRESVVNIDNALQENFDSLYESDRIISSSLKQILIGPLTNLSFSSTSAKYPLCIPKNDTGNEEFVYDLTEKLTIPFVGKDGMGNYLPGLMKGEDFAKFNSVADKFDKESILSNLSWREIEIDGAPPDLRYPVAPMGILVFKINQLQLQVRILEGIINKLFSDNSTYVIGKLNVKHINFVSGGTSSIDLSSSADTNYISSGITKLSY
jgi:hypothetical protein